MNNCDICGDKVVNGKCSCGSWKSIDETKDCPIKKSIEQFHDMKRFTLTADAPHLGCSVVFFRGSYNDCKRVEQFIYEMNNRPFYKDEI